MEHKKTFTNEDDDDNDEEEEEEEDSPLKLREILESQHGEFKFYFNFIKTILLQSWPPLQYNLNSKNS